MKLQQLRYLVVVADSDLNITTAAERLHTAQPGISKQLRSLEAELGFDLFVRQGRALTRMTPEGQQVLKRAQRIVQEIRSLRRLTDDLGSASGGILSIGTTHTQARYVLPPIIREFRKVFPQVRLHLHQGTSEQIADMMRNDQIDLALVTGAEHLFPDTVILPAYRWHRTLIVPKGHPLAHGRHPTLRALAEHPIITYTFSFSGPSSLQDLFASAGLEPNVAITARDADVIKTYVRLGLGVGIVAHMAVDPVEDDDLVTIDAEHLFPAHVTWVGFRRGTQLRTYAQLLLQQIAPHLDATRIESAAAQADQRAVAALFDDVSLPTR
jgi:LysR family cys regulon transcriptional activator